MEKIDYKKLLGKYCSVVMESEGYDFLSKSEFTEEEIKLINESYDCYEDQQCPESDKNASPQNTV